MLAAPALAELIITIKRNGKDPPPPPTHTHKRGGRKNEGQKSDKIQMHPAACTILVLLPVPLPGLLLLVVLLCRQPNSL